MSVLKHWRKKMEQKKPEKQQGKTKRSGKIVQIQKKKPGTTFM